MNISREGVKPIEFEKRLKLGMWHYAVSVAEEAMMLIEEYAAVKLLLVEDVTPVTTSFCVMTESP